jgi:hypothetical protein
VDIGGGDGGGGGGGRGGAVALALLGSRRGRAADALARAARSRPRAKVGEGQQRSRAHPWTSAAVTALAGGGEQRSLCLARVGVGPLTRWLALHACSPGQRWGRVSGARGRIRGCLRR